MKKMRNLSEKVLVGDTGLQLSSVSNQLRHFFFIQTQGRI